jgi:hypothetical protein
VPFGALAERSKWIQWIVFDQLLTDTPANENGEALPIVLLLLGEKAGMMAVVSLFSR